MLFFTITTLCIAQTQARIYIKKNVSAQKHEYRYDICTRFAHQLNFLKAEQSRQSPKNFKLVFH